MTHSGPFQPLLFCDSVIAGSVKKRRQINAVQTNRPAERFQRWFTQPCSAPHGDTGRRIRAGQTRCPTLHEETAMPY